jgi:c(7)-type cytochrome triheme protein
LRARAGAFVPDWRNHCSAEDTMKWFCRLRTVLIASCLAAAFAMAALAGSEISPNLRLPADVTYGSAEGSPGPVIFSHATHVPLTDTRCVACHPEPFSILGPTGRVTHAEMEAGRKCGACHDGVKASGIDDDCSHCHRLEGGP